MLVALSVSKLKLICPVFCSSFIQSIIILIISILSLSLCLLEFLFVVDLKKKTFCHHHHNCREAICLNAWNVNVCAVTVRTRYNRRPMGTRCQKHLFYSKQKRRKEYVNLNEESSLLFSSEVILDAQFTLVMTGIDHSDRLWCSPLCLMQWNALCKYSFVFLCLSPFHFPLLDHLLLLFFPLLPSSSSIFAFVIHFLFTFCIIPFASASGEPCAPSLTVSIHPSVD